MYQPITEASHGEVASLTPMGAVRPSVDTLGAATTASGPSEARDPFASYAGSSLESPRSSVISPTEDLATSPPLSPTLPPATLGSSSEALLASASASRTIGTETSQPPPLPPKSIVPVFSYPTSTKLQPPANVARKRSLERRTGGDTRHGAQTPEMGSFSVAPSEQSHTAPVSMIPSAHLLTQSLQNIGKRKKEKAKGKEKSSPELPSSSPVWQFSPSHSRRLSSTSSSSHMQRLKGLTTAVGGTLSPGGSGAQTPIYSGLDERGDSPTEEKNGGSSSSSSNSNYGGSPPAKTPRRYSGTPGSRRPVISDRMNLLPQSYNISGFDSAYPPPSAPASINSHNGKRKMQASSQDATAELGVMNPLGYRGGDSTTLAHGDGGGSSDLSSSHKKLGFREVLNMASITPYSWDTMDGKAEADDHLHDPNKPDKKRVTLARSRFLLNVGALALLTLGLVLLFAGYPIIHDLTRRGYSKFGAFGLGGTNATGQVSSIPGMRSTLIDPDTPPNAQTRVGSDGETYNLVFSDEFNLDGRSFYPGDDPFWTAVDLHYWGTKNFEWYSPDAITTRGGALQITLSQYVSHNLNFRSGMLQSWNQFCFTGGIMVASVKLPGANNIGGLWPAVWTMGNLGRAGYGASLHGVWPYSYDSCDAGTLANQTDPVTLLPDTSDLGDCVFNKKHGTRALSFLPGQKLSACTCPGEDHPGPRKADGSWKGRAAPEIDLFEAQVDGGGRMSVSQSAQLAPFNARYQLMARSEAYDPQVQMNSYTGEVTQQAASGVAPTNQRAVQRPSDGTAGIFSEFGIEYEPGDNGYIEWINDGKPSWRLDPPALAADPISNISRRPVSDEPMYIIMNVGISENFGTVSPPS